MKTLKAACLGVTFLLAPLQVFAQASVERPNQVKVDLAEVTHILKDESSRKDVFRENMERIAAEIKSIESQLNRSSKGSDQQKLLAERIEEKLSQGLSAQFSYLQSTADARDRVLVLLNRVVGAMPQDLELKKKVDDKLHAVKQLVKGAEEERLRIAQLLLYSSASAKEKESLATELEDAKVRKVDVLKNYAGFLGEFRVGLDQAGTTMAGYRVRMTEMIRFIKSAATKLDVELDKIRLIAQSRRDIAGLRLQFVHLSDAIRTFTQLFSASEVDRVGEWIDEFFVRGGAVNLPMDEVSPQSLRDLDRDNSDVLGFRKVSNVPGAMEDARRLLEKKGDQR